MNFDEYEAVRRGCLTQRIFKFTFCADINAQPSSEYVYEPVIVPGLKIVVGADH